MGKKVKLNENDVKNTLSSMKKVKPPKTVLLNNLTEFWPVLNEDQVKKFEEIMNNFDFKDFTTIGLESTIRNIKSNSIKILLVADEVSPQWFGKHLIAMSLSKSPNIKIFIIPKMKEFAKKILKIPAIICGIKKEVESIEVFYNSLNIHEKLLKQYYTVRPNRNVSIPKKKRKKNDSEIPPIVYLKKESDEQAAFSTSLQPEKMEFETSADFISLAKYDAPEVLHKKSPFRSYRPLKVKKVIGNVNRKSTN